MYELVPDFIKNAVLPDRSKLNPIPLLTVRFQSSYAPHISPSVRSSLISRRPTGTIQEINPRFNTGTSSITPVVPGLPRPPLSTQRVTVRLLWTRPRYREFTRNTDIPRGIEVSSAVNGYIFSSTKSISSPS